jgi:hypothetical protein
MEPETNDRITRCRFRPFRRQYDQLFVHETERDHPAATFEDQDDGVLVGLQHDTCYSVLVGVVLLPRVLSGGRKRDPIDERRKFRIEEYVKTETHVGYGSPDLCPAVLACGFDRNYRCRSDQYATPDRPTRCVGRICDLCAGIRPLHPVSRLRRRRWETNHHPDRHGTRCGTLPSSPAIMSASRRFKCNLNFVDKIG